jgi:hypothetical protein
MRWLVGTSTFLSLMAAISTPAASAQLPQCTVPNTLVNGQVADATDVMENFNAVANCVDDARTEARAENVTHEDTPATGEIAVFTSPTGITGGDLAGDVTTSGSTATQLAPSGVAPGTYYNSTITVDAKGRVTAAESGPLGGGGGSGAWTTLLYQPTYTLPAGTATIINLTTANEVTVAARQIAKDLNGAFSIQFSVDGGVTWVTGPVYIVNISDIGQVGQNATAIAGAATGQLRSHFLHVPNLKSPTPKVFFGNRAGIFDDPRPITHIRIFSTIGTITGGSLTVLGR